MTIEPGVSVADRFEVERHVASGGMGAIFRARDRTSGALVALKCALEGTTSDHDRFVREAQVLAKIAHPAIVRYVDHGTTSSGVPYLAMEWLEGEDLASRLSKGALSIVDSTRLIVRIAGALGTLHERGIVHRDVKPSNVFVVDSDIERVKLLDFGIARSTFGAQLTRTGFAIGTPAYMAPEQARAESGLDARVDVFALGCVLFECIAGRPPFIGEHGVAVLAKILVEEPPSLRNLRPGVSRALDALVARMLAKKRDDRPADGHVVERELRAIEPEDDGASSISSPRAPPGITRAEQRVYSIVLTRPTSGHDTTMLAQEPKKVEGDARVLVRKHGGDLYVLANGSMLIVVDSSAENAASSAADDAARAAECALGLASLVGPQNVAMATGRGVASGRLPIGEVIDRASELLTRPLDEGNGVRIDKASASLLDRRFVIAGPATNGDLFLAREREVEEGVRTLLGRSTRCVGREREMATLDVTLTQSILESSASALLITAPPGTGKSRLVHEFLAAARDRDDLDGLEVLVARAHALSAGSPFATAARMIRHAAGFSEGEDASLKHRKLTARIARSLPQKRAEELAELLGEIAGASPPDSAESDRLRALRKDAVLFGDAIRAAWEEWIAAECTQHPLLLVLEDLHWGDVPSTKLVDGLLRNLHDRPLVVVATARPEVHESFPGLWAERGVQEIRLGVVSRRASERFVRDLLGASTPEAVVSMIVERAAGHPFYLEELIRAVAEGSRATALPDTVLGMIQARLDALGPEPKRVLRAASVFGETFWISGIKALVGDAVSGVGDLLESLCEREIVERRPRSTVPGEHELVFRHALVRDAAYAMLTDDDRKLAHRAAGSWLESVGARDAIVLAEHFERGGAPESALRWFVLGAEQALEGNDLSNALGLAQRALKCSPDRETDAKIRLVLAEASYHHGDLLEGERFAIEAAERLEPGTDRWFDSVSAVIMCAGQRGNNDAVATWLDAACAHPSEIPTGAELVCLCRGISHLQFANRSGDAARATARVAAIEPIARSFGPLANGWLHRVQAESRIHRGMYDVAVREYERARDLFREAGATRNAILMEALLLSFASVYGRTGIIDELLVVQAEADRLALPYLSSFVRVELVAVYALEGRYEESLATGRLCLPMITGSKRLELWTLRFMCISAIAVGDLAQAEAYGRQGVASAKMDFQRCLAEAYLSRSLLAAGRNVEALEHARNAARRSTGALTDVVGDPEYALALALEANGDREGAKQALLNAVERVRAQASQLESPDNRARALDRPLPNREIMALAREWGLLDS